MGKQEKSVDLTMREKAIGAWPPAILIVFNLFFYAPFNIYKGNIGEFGISLSSILGSFLIPSALLTIFLTGVGMVLRKEAHFRYVSTAFVLGVLIWLQGNILLWKYGLLDGQGIDWTRGLWRGWVDGALWLALLSLGCLLYDKMYRVVWRGSIALISLQVIFVFLSSFQNTEIWKGKEVFSGASLPEKIREFSSRQNIIHIILDGFQSNVFQEIINDDLLHYQKSLEGFTFFKETTGSFPTTRMSIPAILSGKNYKNDISMSDFIKAVYEGDTITNAAYENGYEVDFIIAIGSLMRLQHSNLYMIPVPYNVNKKEYVQANSALMLDLVLLRAAPYLLKRYIYNNQLWFVQQLLEENEFEKTFFAAHTGFVEDLIGNLSANREKLVYKFIHLQATHPPFVVNGDCKYPGKVVATNMENAKKQGKCCLDQIIRFLDKLKNAGIYDSSLIILQADHGLGLSVELANMDKSRYEDRILSARVGSALPLLLVKPPHRKGALKISQAQVMLTDIPVTISSLMNLNGDFTGRSVFEVDPTISRERRYHHYEWRHEHWQADFFSHMDEYIIKGSVFDKDSWRSRVTSDSHGESSYLTNSIDFGTRQASRFLRSGWSHKETEPEEGPTYSWALGDSASIFLSLPKGRVNFSAKVKTPKFHKPQQITIRVDGNVIGSWELSTSSRRWERPWKWENRNIVIGADKDRPKVSVVEFLFSQHRKPDDKDNRPLAVLFGSVTLSKAINANQ